ASDFAVNYGAGFYPLGVLAIVISFSLIAYAIFRYRLLDVTIFIRRAALLTAVYIGLVLLVIPVVIALQRKVGAVAPPASSLFMSLQIIGAGAVLSLGPLLYAYFVKRSSYFREHTMAGLTHELKSPLAAIESAAEVLMDKAAAGEAGRG